MTTMINGMELCSIDSVILHRWVESFAGHYTHDLSLLMDLDLRLNQGLSLVEIIFVTPNTWSTKSKLCSHEHEGFSHSHSPEVNLYAYTLVSFPWWSGPFEKFTRVTMVLPLTGQQYSEKVAENCVAAWKAMGVYTEAEGAAVEKFKDVFKAETFPHGASILFTHSPSGSLTIGLSKDGSVPEAGVAVIENKALSEAVLESIIGEHGVSPAAKRSLAFRVSELLKEPHGHGAKEEMVMEKPIAMTV